MLKGIKKRDNSFQRLNLIPILDAVFIFIFFLLMSAQFIDIFQLETEAPAISTFKEEDNKDKKPPLNLTLEIHKNRIYIRTGLEGNLAGSIDKREDYDFYGLNDQLQKLKKLNALETSVIFKPATDIPYESIIKIIDNVRVIPQEFDPISIKNKEGVIIETRILFNKIIFETII